MDLKKIYLIKYGTEKFEKETLVKYEACSDSGNCYLVSDLNNNLKREWVMYFDLYPLDWKNGYNSNYYYNNYYQSIGYQLLSIHSNK